MAANHPTKNYSRLAVIIIYSSDALLMTHVSSWVFYYTQRSGWYMDKVEQFIEDGYELMIGFIQSENSGVATGIASGIDAMSKEEQLKFKCQLIADVLVKMAND